MTELMTGVDRLVGGGDALGTSPTDPAEGGSEAAVAAGGGFVGAARWAVLP